MKRTEIADTRISYHAQRSRRGAARAALAACVIATLPATGCRSGGSSWNMFSRSEPSAEVLAGSGPTTTYPSPPSTRATPEAIASIAGGTTVDKTESAPETPGATSPPGGANPHTLAGNITDKPERSVPTGFPTGPAPSDDPHPTVSTTVAADKNSVPPSYAMPGRSSSKATSDLAATANGYAGVPGATPPSKPKDAGGLPSGYQLGKQPAAGSDAALASSPAEPPSNSTFTMPPAGGTPPAGGDASPDSASTAKTAAPAKAGGFGLPSDLIPSASESVATASTASSPASPSTAGAPSKMGVATDADGPADSTAVAALGLPPSESSRLGNAAPGENAPDGDSKAPEYKTASTTKTNAGSGGAGASQGGVQPAGYRPGSTGKSSSYPVLR